MSETSSREGGFDPLEYEAEIRMLLGLEEGASDKEVANTIDDTNAKAVRALLGLIPEATDMEVLTAMRARKAQRPSTEDHGDLLKAT